jgi:CLIP-associating protein 1/2
MNISRPSTRDSNAIFSDGIYDDNTENQTPSPDPSDPSLPTNTIRSPSPQKRISMIPGTTIFSRKETAKVLSNPSTPSRPLSELTGAQLNNGASASRLVDSGIARIRSNTLDAHGYRKLTQVITSGAVSWTPESFSALTIALLDTLLIVCGNENLLTQLLGTVQALFQADRGLFQPHVGLAMSVVVLGKALSKEFSHAGSLLEALWRRFLEEGGEKAEDVVALLTSMMSGDGEGSVAVRRECVKGIHEILSFSAAQQDSGSMAGDEHMVKKLGALVVQCMREEDAGVRREGVTVAVVLYDGFKKMGVGSAEERLWGVMPGLGEGDRAFLTYFCRKRDGEVAGE